MIRSKALFKNFTWLAISQGANFLIPLIVYPYLLRIVGIEEFGLIIFAQAIVTYFVYIVDYGFSITAVREVSLNRDDPGKLSVIFNKLYFTKIILLAISFAVLYLLTSMIKEWDNHSLLFLTSFSIVIGQLFLPLWWFQGMEKMNGVAFINIISKALFVLLVLLFINENADFMWVNFYLGVSQIVVGLIATVAICVKYHIRVVSPSFSLIGDQLRENRSIFLSVLAGFISGNSNLVILGFIADPVSTGYYAIVEKILLAIRAPAVLLYQTIFPKVCRLAVQSFDKLISFLKTTTRLIFMGFIPLTLITHFFSGDILRLFSGEYLEQPSHLLKIVSMVPLLAALNIPACQTTLAYNLKRSYARITIGGAIFNITINIILVSAFSAYGSAIAALATELFVTTMLFLNLALFHQQYSVFGVFKTN